MKKKPKQPDYLMDNMLIHLQSLKLLRLADYDGLLACQTWEEKVFFLKRFEYQLPEQEDIVQIDAFYQQEMSQLYQRMKQTQVPQKYIDPFFIVSQTLAAGSFDSFDERVLARYVAVIEADEVPLLTEFAKQKVDAFFLALCLEEEASLQPFLRFAKGYLAPNELEKVRALRLEKRLPALRLGHYHQLLQLVEKKEQLEDRFEQSLMTLFHPSRQQVRGIEGMLAYVQDQINELYNIRLFLKGKIYHMKDEYLKERMRYPYGYDEVS